MINAFMFTDWTQTDPKYFYVRGIILGAVGTLSLVRVIITKTRK